MCAAGKGNSMPARAIEPSQPQEGSKRPELQCHPALATRPTFQCVLHASHLSGRMLQRVHISRD